MATEQGQFVHQRLLNRLSTAPPPRLKLSCSCSVFLLGAIPLKRLIAKPWHIGVISDSGTVSGNMPDKRARVC